ncbi:unnamed protein product [Symbiodinium sp. CCMP2456]|nr:unnamed protein product [Symbiodinium sp. CCMP2456]
MAEASEAKKPLVDPKDDGDVKEESEAAEPAKAKATPAEPAEPEEPAELPKKTVWDTFRGGITSTPVLILVLAIGANVYSRRDELEKDGQIWWLVPIMLVLSMVLGSVLVTKIENSEWRRNLRKEVAAEERKFMEKKGLTKQELDEAAITMGGWLASTDYLPQQQLQTEWVLSYVLWIIRDPFSLPGALGPPLWLRELPSRPEPARRSEGTLSTPWRGKGLRCLPTVSTPESLPDLDSPGLLSPKFAQGDLVRIRTISEEEASRVFKASGIHWNSSKAALLGTVGELRSVGSDYYAVYTPDQSDWWRWPLAMLERADGTSVRRPGSREGPFCEGQLVKILEMSEEEAEGICLAWTAAMSPIADWGWPEHEAVFSPREMITIEEDTTRSAQGWSAPMAAALGQQGRVEAVFRQRCRVATSGGCFWWPFSALEALRCPDGHTLEEVYASDGACCATCSRDLTEERCGRCDACRLDLCSSCADQAQLARARGFVEGAVVRMTMDDTAPRLV